MRKTNVKTEEKEDVSPRSSLPDGQHHSDPPKVFIASDLKPEQLSETVNQLELEDWVDRAECYAEASNITFVECRLPPAPVLNTAVKVKPSGKSPAKVPPRASNASSSS